VRGIGGSGNSLGELPALTSGAVHLWRASLDLAGSELDELYATLDDDERARARRFRADADRNRFVAARGILRALVAGYLGVGARDLVIAYGRWGKPAVAGPRGAEWLRFNLSHSGSLAVIAFAAGREVGVDVEPLRTLDDTDLDVARLFSSGERAALSALAGRSREEAFLACWTRKEAYVKARGEGLAHPLASFDVLVGPDEPTRLVDPSANAAAGPRRWTITPIAPAVGYVGAVAVEGGPPRLEPRTWRGASHPARG
jgi:4'-phosphopantetheinyl transferase